MTTEIPIEIIKLEDDSYHLMVEAEFSDKIFGNLIIDTGASKTVFDKEFTAPFITNKEEVDDQNSSGINAMLNETEIGTVPLLKLNKLEVRNLKSLLLDLSHINNLYQKYTDKHIAGLIGSDLLVKYQAIIDYKQQILFLNNSLLC